MTFYTTTIHFTLVPGRATMRSYQNCLLSSSSFVLFVLWLCARTKTKIDLSRLVDRDKQKEEAVLLCFTAQLKWKHRAILLEKLQFNFHVIVVRVDSSFWWTKLPLHFLVGIRFVSVDFHWDWIFDWKCGLREWDVFVHYLGSNFD